MKNRRRSDDAHDIGDSSPGTDGHSKGTYHDGRDMQTVDPEEDTEVPAPQSESSAKESSDQGADAEDEKLEEPTPMQVVFAKQQGDNWSADKRRQFLSQYDVTREELDWTLPE